MLSGNMFLQRWLAHMTSGPDGCSRSGCEREYLKVNLQEVATLARCQSENITQYYASVLKPGTSELLIVMELMAASVADLVGLHPQPQPPHLACLLPAVQAGQIRSVSLCNAHLPGAAAKSCRTLIRPVPADAPAMCQLWQLKLTWSVSCSWTRERWRRQR